MDINSSSYYSVSASTNKGMSGLASGMDTASMVEQMLSGTQGKIDKQQGMKTQAEWKQEIYRDIVTSINGFNDKYFDTSFGASLSTNLAKSSFFNSMLSSVSGGSGVRVISTDSDASIGDMSVKVTNLAKSASLAGTAQLSAGRKIEGNKISDEMLTENLTRKIAFQIDGKDIKVNLDGATTDEAIVERINAEIKDVLNPSGDSSAKVEAKLHNGRLRLVINDTTTKVTVNSSKDMNALGQKATGMAGTASVGDVTDENGAVTGRTITFAGQVDASVGPSFTLTVDGVSKQITLNNLNGTGTGKEYIKSNDVLGALEKEVKKAFGDLVSVEWDGTEKKFKFGLKSSEPGHQLTITGFDASKIGIVAGSSASINGSTKLADLGLGGDQFKFTINGEKFTFTGSDSVSTVMNKINTSSAGVRMSYSALADTFKLESTSTGAEYDIELSQEQGNLLTKLFGKKAGTTYNAVKTAESSASKLLATGKIAGGEAIPSDMEVKSGASFKVTVNGVTKTITLPTDKDGKTVTYKGEKIADALNAQLKEAFYVKDEYGKPKLDDKGNKTGIIQLSKNATGVYELTVANDPDDPNDYVVEFAATTVDLADGEAVAEAKKTDLALLFGFNKKATSNIATGESSLADPNIASQLKGLKFTKADGATVVSPSELSEFNDENNPIYLQGARVKFEDGRLILSEGVGGTSAAAPSDANAKAAFETLFGENTIYFGDGKASGDAVAKGENAKATINGIEVTRSSNTFAVDGITLELVKVGEETNTISVKQDTDKIVDGIKAFVEDYNKLIEKLHGFVDADRTYRKYDPLTSAQRKEMSDKEIELWEEKAKEGLLHRESDVDAFLSSMRLAMYSKPEGSKLTLPDIGIDTSTYKNKGKLFLDETALRKALSSDPQSISLLFTGPDGLASKIQNAVKTAANSSSASPGALVRTAGMKGYATEKENILSNDITRISDRIKTLQAQYERERQRYWNQFNSMETTLSNLNNQSSYFMQQFG